MVQALLILTGDTGRCNKDSINAPSMESFDDGHLLIGIIVGSAENYTEARATSNFFNAFHNITQERIVNGCHYQANHAGAPRLQALRDSVGGIAHLLRQALDALSCVQTNEWTFTQCP